MCVWRGNAANRSLYDRHRDIVILSYPADFPASFDCCFLLDFVLILLGEILSWSLMGLKGLILQNTLVT